MILQLPSQICDWLRCHIMIWFNYDTYKNRKTRKCFFDGNDIFFNLSSFWKIRTPKIKQIRFFIHFQHISVSLLQFHPPTPTNKTTFHNCGLYVYELKRPKNSSRKLPLKHFQYNSLHARSKLFTNFQETVIRMDVNTAHSYVIIPCTFYPEKSAQFLLRVFTDGECLITELNWFINLN